MRRYIHLIVLLLCLASTLYAQSPVLETKVSVQYREVEIRTILRDLSKRYNLKFFYANNVMPEKKRVSIAMKNVMLKDVLYDIFSDTDVAFQVIGDQIVFKKGLKRSSITLRNYNEVKANANAKAETTSTLYDPAVFGEDISMSNSKDYIIDTMPDELDLEVPLLVNDNYNPTKGDLRRKYKGEKKILKAKYYVLKESNRSKGGKTLDNLQMKYNYVAQKLRQEYINFRSQPYVKDSSMLKLSEPVLTIDSLSKMDSIVPSQENNYLYTPFQVSFASPVGTNGKECGRYVNSFSLNALWGYSAGLEGVELAGIANVEKDFVNGAQMAGFINAVNGTTSGIQLAGFANVCGDSVRAVQAAGFCNVADGSVTGIQVAGFCNVNDGAVNGLQGAGFINVNEDSLNGVQAAGFANISGGDVDGMQISGFINTARKVKGMQIGIFNVADSIQGVPIGLMSFVKKGGHRVVDVNGSEALYATVAYKMGVRSFYNIFPVGAQYKNNKWRVGFGYGIGSEAKLGQKGFANTELVSMFIWEESMVNQSELNLMNRLSSSFGLNLGKRTALFAGPALNVMVSSYQDPDKTEVGSEIAPYTLYDYTSTGGFKDVNVKIWMGFNLGIRF